MSNKPMLSVERELLSNLSYAIAANDMHACVSIGKELRALLDKPDTPYTPKGEWSFEYIDGGDIVIRNGEDWTLIKRGDGPIYEQFLYRFCEEQLKPADHPQCEECKGWGYHENHHEGGGTECGECSGSGKAPVEQFSGDTVVCRRYQLEQSPGQNFYHYDKEPVYGSVPVTLYELVSMSEPAPGAVVMPERMSLRSSDGSETYETKAWNAALDAVAKLNGVNP